MVELTAEWETDRTEYGGQETVKKGWYGDLHKEKLQFKLSVIWSFKSITR